ncbi:MAG TPA: hypothetical protein VGN98_06930 [Tianweitania sediminis]|jgi:hypothetical protein|nr:hypothetical protein [Tianweitania sediminis]
MKTREIYASSNGDRWHLVKDPSGAVLVRHEANVASGGNIAFIDIPTFLNLGAGPEQQSLLAIIATLVDEPAERVDLRRETP